MKELQERIRTEGRVLPGHILKVDSFLNHQVDLCLMDGIGRTFAELYRDEGITKVLTIEASGIVPAAMTALHMNVPLVFAKKANAANQSPDVWQTSVHSYTYDRDYVISVTKTYLTAEDRVLIIDDFLANGEALKGLMDLCTQAGAKIAGAGICIEKGFQKGGKELRDAGLRVESLAIIESMDDGTLTFRGQEKTDL